MIKKHIQFTGAATQFYFDGSMDLLNRLAGGRRIIVLTDERVYAAHKRKLSAYDLVIMPAGESYKNQTTVDAIIGQLVAFEADRQTLLVGIGGGVVTDIAGYVAAIYLRGISVGFVPTTILAMVDAAIGGKNGIDVGIYKNIVGSIRQPEFLLYDYSLLKSLPKTEWINGFAEVIKHAAIKDAAMFNLLKETRLSRFQKDNHLLHTLIMRNAMIKIKVVQEDEFEKGDRKLLNFGHTLGHAIENMLQLPHGHAISIGMVYAAHLSAQITGFPQSPELILLLEQYGLPTHAAFNKTKAINNLMMDKKRQQDTLQFILLERIGKAVIHPVAVASLAESIIADQ